MAYSDVGMARLSIGILLVLGLLFHPQPTISVPLKKACCRPANPASECNRHGDGKCDCCGLTSAPVPIIMGLAKTEIYTHPAANRETTVFSGNYSARSEAPPLPPPKVA